MSSRQGAKRGRLFTQSDVACLLERSRECEFGNTPESLDELIERVERLDGLAFPVSTKGEPYDKDTADTVPKLRVTVEEADGTIVYETWQEARSQWANCFLRFGESEEDLAGRFTGSSYWDVPDPIATSRRVGVLEGVIRASAGMYGSEILTGLKQRKWLGSGKRAQRPFLCVVTCQEVHRRQKGICICGCGRPIAPFPIGYHHLLPKQRWPELTDVAANVVGVTADDHAAHETAHRRLPRSACATVEALASGGRAQSYLDRTYGVRKG